MGHHEATDDDAYRRPGALAGDRQEHRVLRGEAGRRAGPQTMSALPALDGVITADEVHDTATHLASLQLESGMIPWFEGGHCDPWNHVESAMALDVAGHHAEAERAYEWLVDTQLPNGGWYAY